MILTGTHILVTAGPTHEPIDPVRYLANRSSGKQGFAIAAALARRGARVTLIAGPVVLETPADVTRIDVETAREMAAAVDAALPADAAILVAAVADWRVAETGQKIKKDGTGPPVLRLIENPDILAGLAISLHRPRLLVGFAAETEAVIAHATAKRARKNVDWIVANDVSGDVMGGAANTVHIVTASGVESWPLLSKGGRRRPPGGPDRRSARSVLEPELLLELVDHLRGIGLVQVRARRRDLGLLAQSRKVRRLRTRHRVAAGHPILGVLLGIRIGMLIELGIMQLLGHIAPRKGFLICSKPRTPREVPLSDAKARAIFRYIAAIR